VTNLSFSLLEADHKARGEREREKEKKTERERRRLEAIQKSRREKVHARVFDEGYDEAGYE